MKRGKDKDELVEYLKAYIPMLLRSKALSKEVVERMEEIHNVDEGSLMNILSNYNVLEDQDELLLGIIAEQIYTKVPEAKKDLMPMAWFNSLELEKMKRFVFEDHTKGDELTLPLVFEDVTDVGGGVFAVPVDYSMIARMRKHRVLNYNFDIQREAKLYNIMGKVVKVMNIEYKNVHEMVDLILKDELVKTTLAYNCATDTSTSEYGEITYDSKDRTLTIHDGTRIDILDGAHRTLAFYEAYKKSPNLEGKIMVYFSNYTPAQAHRYQAQLAKATPISNSRRIELENKSYSTTLVNRIKDEKIMEDRVAMQGMIRESVGTVVLYTKLVDAFDSIWQPSNIKEVNAIKKPFIDYMEEYIPFYDDLYMVERKSNPIFNRSLFALHVALAKKMNERKIPYYEVSNILANYNEDTDKELLHGLISTLTSGSYKGKKAYAEIEEYADKLLN